MTFDGYFAIYWTIFPFVLAWAAKEKDRNYKIWFLLGLFFNMFALFLLANAGDNDQGYQ